jgi:hypothetical protein
MRLSSLVILPAMAVKPRSAARWELRRLINGYQVSQALHVLAELGIPDRLADGPLSAEELATLVGASDEPLYRLLRAVAAIGVLEELPGRRFRLTELGEGLRSDVPGSLAGWAAFIGRRSDWTGWARLIDGVRSGDFPFQLEHGTDPWSYRRAHPDEVPIFNRAMNSMSSQMAESVVAAYDFSRFGTVVDVGGGGGALIVEILSRNPAVRGVLFDEPHVVADARSYIEQAGLAGRCELVGGSFFETVPGGADAYLLKSVLHDWYDEDAERILKVCRAAMRPDALLLIVERLIGPPNEGAVAKLSDLMMLVAAGGRERTADEWETVLRASGFELRSIVPTDDVAVIEAGMA